MAALLPASLFHICLEQQILQARKTADGRSLCLESSPASVQTSRPLSLREKAHVRAAYYHFQKAQESVEIPQLKHLIEVTYFLRSIQLWSLVQEFCFTPISETEPPFYKKLPDYGLFSEQIELCQSLLGQFSSKMDGELRYQLGMAHLYICNYDQGLGQLEELYQRAVKEGNLYHQSLALEGLAFGNDQWGKHQRAIHFGTQLLESFEAYDDSGLMPDTELLLLQGRTFSMLGRACMFIREYEQAKTYFEQAIALSQSQGDEQTLWYTLGRLAFVYAQLGKSTQALSLLDQQAQLTPKTARAEGTRDLVLGMCECYRNDFNGAVKYFETSVEKSHEGQDYNVQCFSMLALVFILALQKRYQDAINLAQEALSLAQKLDYFHQQCSAYFQLSSIYFELEDVQCCEFYAEQAVAISQNVDLPGYRQMAQSARAGTYLMKRQYRQFFRLMRMVWKDFSWPLTRENRILLFVILRKVWGHIKQRVCFHLAPRLSQNDEGRLVRKNR